MANFIEYLFVIFFALLSISIVGYIALIGVKYIPVATNEPNVIAPLTTYTLSLIDSGIFIIFILALFFDLLASYFSPSKLMGIINIIGLFMLGYLVLIFNNLLPVFLALNTNVMFPITYSLFASTWKTVIIFFFMIFSIIFDLSGNKTGKREK